MKLELSKTNIIRFGIDSDLQIPTIKINNKDIEVDDHLK